MIERKNTDIIIVHHSLSHKDTTIDEVKQWHADRGFDDIGYHFFIPWGGQYQRGRDIRLVGAHAKGKNGNSIGICFAGDFRKYGPSSSQINEFVVLVNCLKTVYGNLDIVPHREYDNPCPGPKFDLDYTLSLMP